jgi:hypothetical protein
MRSRWLYPVSLLARFWFPLALIVLLLLAIPGFLLFGLHLFSMEGPVNIWLKGAYQLSYHISVSWWWALLLLLVPLAILLLYFLKLKRKPISVPSTFLWRKSIEDLHVNALLQWLRHNVLLLLQLLAVLGLIYGIMGFRFHGNTAEGKHYILMIDNSASMAATDVEPNRLQWAKQEALKEVDACTDNDVGMVIVFNSSAEIRQSYTSNRNLLRDALNKVEQTQRVTRIEEALSLADSQANPSRSVENQASPTTDTNFPREGDSAAAEPISLAKASAEGISAEVHLFSDGRFPAVPEFSLGKLNLHYHAAGKLVVDVVQGKGSSSQPVMKPAPESADNVAIVTFNALRDETDPTRLQAFVSVRNFRPDTVSTRVQLEVLVNGALKGVYEKPLNVPARKVTTDTEPGKDEPTVHDTAGESSAAFSLSELDDRADVVLHARLMEVHDKFPLDDEAWLVLGVARKARVLIVGNGNDILEKFFEAEEVAQVAQVDRLTPADLGKDSYQKPARNGVYDLVIFDRCAPATEAEMPRSNTFFIGYPPPPWKKENLATIDNPHITGWMNKNAVLKDLTALYQVDIDQTFKMKDLPPRTPLLIEARRIDKNSNVDTALLLTLSRHSYTDLIMTFPIITDKGEWNTTWPLQTSFPLFLRNILYHLGNLSDTATEETVQPGQVKIIRPDAAVFRLDVLNPDGTEHRLTHDERDPRTDFAYGATDGVGVYKLKWDGQVRRSFVVNLLDADESNIEPVPAVQIGSERIATGQEHSQPRDLWKWFALAALILLIVEWYIYNRRIYV